MLYCWRGLLITLLSRNQFSFLRVDLKVFFVSFVSFVSFFCLSKELETLPEHFSPRLLPGVTVDDGVESVVDGVKH